jgi:beta-1,4-mannosyl-glycoprotein beta-1,4-N-acetylglucosaminyltransferase
MRKIYDCVPFFNELDILEIRLELLYDHVDYFIISECDTTFSGLNKPFYYEDNKEKFRKYWDKIIHIKHENCKDTINIENNYSDKKKDIMDDILTYYKSVQFTRKTNNGASHWCREVLQREYVRLGMVNCNDDDIIIFSDLDEIPNPEKMVLDGKSYLMNQKNMIYFINKENVTEKWHGTVITKFSNVDSLNELRGDRFSFNKIDNGGWHLSFMGGEERIKEKIKSYSHQEFNNNSILSAVDNKMNKNMDILNRNITIKNISVDDYYPDVLIKLINEKFKYLIK